MLGEFVELSQIDTPHGLDRSDLDVSAAVNVEAVDDKRVNTSMASKT